MLSKELEASDQIRLCHIGIELANAKSDESKRKEKKRKVGSDDSSPNKKKSCEPTLTFQQNCNLSLSYIHTSENPSDYLSRTYSKSDAYISKRTWNYIQQKFGPHTVDMFSLDSNAMLDNEGFAISHFTPYKSPLSSGVDAFAQIYKSNENYYYAFPPFCLIIAVVKFIKQEKITCTLIFPDFKPVKPWITVILSCDKNIITIGYKGDKGVLLYPSKKGFYKIKKAFSAIYVLQNVHSLETIMLV
ncbi:unnamed protein product [Mytilus coruscus]|uniref:Uncharacterized protein n=1 Tax=Mytilus coruscus TaxID=42192 RepID=A0A6J8E081_MYTCO|nr:unnamed protein product [Mytilus coruscus]